MVVNPDGVVRSQRRDPRLAIIQPRISADDTHLTLHAADTEPVHLAVDLDAPRRDVLLFGARFQGLDQGNAVAEWLSHVLGAPSRWYAYHRSTTASPTDGSQGRPATPTVARSTCCRNPHWICSTSGLSAVVRPRYR